MTISQNALEALKKAVRDATIKVLGADLVKNDAEISVLISIIRAFGNSEAGFIYVSPSRARSTLRPPDTVLCHPDVGLLVIEVKSHPIDVIQGIEAGSIMVRYQGRNKPENAVRQAEDQMFEIRSDVEKLVHDQYSIPLFNCMVAFPNISEAEWASRGYDKAHPGSQLLFKDHIENLPKLKQRVAELVQDGLKRSGKSTPLTKEQIKIILQAFGNSDVINEQRPARVWIEQGKLGSEIDEMVAAEKYLSEEQKTYSQLAIGQYPRVIRGVAGSGKSIVLANLVARFLQRRLPSFDDALFGDGKPNIAAVCFNQTLVSFLKKKIKTAYREQTLNEDIPPEVLTVTHLNGLMWELIQNGCPIKYVHIDEIPDASARAANYRQQLKSFAESQPEFYAQLCFDVIFVDEGQDLEPEEYRLLMDLVKEAPRTHEKPLIIFYDDVQNLYGRTRPIWQEIGLNVAVGDRSRVMKECFRNTRQIVELAFNVLLGSQAEPDVRIQTRTYADVASLKSQGMIVETENHFRVNFTEREYRHPEVQSFPNRQAEVAWIANEVKHLVSDEQVRPEDILILLLKPKDFAPAPLEAAIRGCIPSIQFVKPFGNSEDKKNYIFREGAITLSTVYGAKGYDAPIVFVVGVDTFPTDKEGRAAFYVAATRSKLLLYISGVESTNSNLLKEAHRVLQVL